MAANDNAITCGADFSFLDLLASAIGVDATGKNYLRYYEPTNVAGSKAVICGGDASQTNLDAIVLSLFALDANGDVAIRIAKA